MKKSFIFYPTRENIKISYAVDSWILFLTSRLGGRWNSEEIKTIGYSSQDDILAFGQYEETLDYALVIVLCSTETVVSNEYFKSNSCEKISLSTFIPNAITDKSTVIFDSIIDSSLCYYKLKRTIECIDDFVIHNMQFFIGSGANERLDTLLRTSNPGNIVVKPTVFYQSENLPGRIADFILNNGNRGIVPYGKNVRFGWFPYSVKKLLQEVNIFLSNKEQYCCFGDGYSFPIAIIPWAE